ncbi:guanylyl cyclase C-like [Ruditapes philippinarum]|uniref:guanylyl cyclase C-like n=1 Tax=Ruditapes philippinarum TaxID=129788 RepID=UPI00295A7001|nr:guanylyl cyclase C-like [Ruditapes philippinarum]
MEQNEGSRRNDVKNTRKWEGEGLYNLIDDPPEHNDISELYPDLVKEMEAKFDKYRKGLLPNKDLLLYNEKRVLGQHFLNRSMMNSDFARNMFEDMFIQTQLAADIKKMRSRISQNIAQNASTASGIVWFDNMTEYINILEVIQDALAERIVQHAVEENKYVESTLVACIVQLFIAIVTVPIIFFLVNNIVNISSLLEKKKFHLEAEKHQTELLIQKLETERKRTKELLYQLLPKSVANTIMENGFVEPESYNAATIMFSDVVGFTRISSVITPMQVVAMLNGLYMAIDGRLELFDVYKVETIGDGYMVASGLPKRNEDRHVIEIARLSLDLLNTVKHVDIDNLRENHLQLRIGFHTGPCVAGVVGIRMPRYCIFGDTVNTASRMESTGLPMQIQMTKSSTKHLRKLIKFQIRKRGQIEVKGKGLMTTYWLLGYNSNDNNDDKETESSH